MSKEENLRNAEESPEKKWDMLCVQGLELIKIALSNLRKAEGANMVDITNNLRSRFQNNFIQDKHKLFPMLEKGIGAGLHFQELRLGQYAGLYVIGPRRGELEKVVKREATRARKALTNVNTKGPKWPGTRRTKKTNWSHKKKTGTAVLQKYRKTKQTQSARSNDQLSTCESCRSLAQVRKGNKSHYRDKNAQKRETSAIEEMLNSLPKPFKNKRDTSHIAPQRVTVKQQPVKKVRKAKHKKRGERDELGRNSGSARKAEGGRRRKAELHGSDDEKRVPAKKPRKATQCKIDLVNEGMSTTSEEEEKKEVNCKKERQGKNTTPKLQKNKKRVMQSKLKQQDEQENSAKKAKVAEMFQQDEDEEAKFKDEGSGAKTNKNEKKQRSIKEGGENEIMENESDQSDDMTDA